MYFRLAWGNMRKSLRDYGIYLITISLGVAVFYAFNTISEQTAFLSESTSEALSLLADLILIVTLLLAGVLGFLMVYANNFLVRRRKREIGLYQLLGMTKRQASLVLCLECGTASLLAFAIGLGIGILLSQLLVFVTATIFNDTVRNFTFIFSVQGLLLASVCFGVMFCVMLVFDIAIVGKVRIVDLMQGSRRVESQRVRPLWLCSIIAAAGLVVLGIAYARLLRDGLPVFLSDDDQTTPFLLTTLMCVCGTLLLFWGLPTPALAIIRHVKGYYLRDLHMFSARQVASRVNSSAIAMGVTALVLFLALTSVTGGMSIASGLHTSLAYGNPFAATVMVDYVHPDEGSWTFPASEYLYSEEMDDVPVAEKPVDLGAWLAGHYADVLALVDGESQVDIYESAPRGFAGADELSYAEDGIPTLGAFGEVSGSPFPERFASIPETTLLQVVPLSHYNASRALLGMESVELPADEYLFLCNLGPTIVRYFDAGLAAGARFKVGGEWLSPAAATCVSDASASIYDGAYGTNSGTLVVADDLVADLPLIASVLELQCPPEGDEAFAAAINEQEVAYYTQDSTGTAFKLYEGDNLVAFVGSFTTRQEVAEGEATMTGMIGYLATYIGFVLVVGCAAILAIQQLSQMADSLGRYRLVHELGAAPSQVNASVLFQTGLSFALPLIVGLCHAVVALTVLAQVMELLAPMDVTSSISLTAVIFVVVYGGYFLATYLMARRLADARYLGLRMG